MESHRCANGNSQLLGHQQRLWSSGRGVRFSIINGSEFCLFDKIGIFPRKRKTEKTHSYAHHHLRLEFPGPPSIIFPGWCLIGAVLRVSNARAYRRSTIRTLADDLSTLHQALHFLSESTASHCSSRHPSGYTDWSLLLLSPSHPEAHDGANRTRAYQPQKWPRRNRQPAEEKPRTSQTRHRGV